MLLVWSGSAATVLVVYLSLLLRWAGLTRLDPARHAAALLSHRTTGVLRGFAGLAFLLFLGGLVFPLAYWLVFSVAGRADPILGLLAGAVHGLVAGLVLPLLPRRDADLPPPGLFGYRAGPLTPLALIVLHALYGCALGLLYAPGV